MRRDRQEDQIYRLTRQVDPTPSAAVALLSIAAAVCSLIAPSLLTAAVSCFEQHSRIADTNSI